MSNFHAESILSARRALLTGENYDPAPGKSPTAAEGGCGVLGLAANLPIPGRHVLGASQQMHNRGNGKGGGIAMAGLDPHQARVDRETLRSHYLLQIALLDPDVEGELERAYIQPHFEIAQAYALDHLDDYRQISSLEVRPPDVRRYFVRVKPDSLQRFARDNHLERLPARALEDEFVYQNTFKLNREFYASLGSQRAFVLSHGRDLSVLKIVGYAEDVVRYYRLEQQMAHIWVAHQRYPTKGRVWHPGGAHPFIGLNEALVHNGDFANYHAVSEYLRQRNIEPLFLTDTEVGVQLFDLWDRVYGYPLEITLEAMAPTSEHDMAMLPPDKQEVYRAVQRAHIHGSPDGPWFFILARSLPDRQRWELLGITDTSMLRPQVFAMVESPGQAKGASSPPVQIGLVASERQAINACLRSISQEDERFQPLADSYWTARGGSYTDGGAFRFILEYPGGPTNPSDSTRLTCEDKFGQIVRLASGKRCPPPREVDPSQAGKDFQREWEQHAYRAFDNGGPLSLWPWLRGVLADLSWDETVMILDWLEKFAESGQVEWEFVRGALNLLHDRRFDSGDKKRASLVALVDECLRTIFNQASLFSDDGGEKVPTGTIRRLTWDQRQKLQPPIDSETPLILDTLGFPPEGEESAARWIVRAHRLGWRRILAYNWRGGRFAGCGLGPGSQGASIELYGDVGDYAASGLDGAEVQLHGDGQDQMGQILNKGKLVVHGDVGQTFLYGAKGGEIYVLGSAAGRPLINAVGSPRAVINGTCLDYLAESFMAGDPLDGGGFAILNGVTFDRKGQLKELASPYPGGNLFSLASGGAIYLRDPHWRVDEDQLNGGRFTPLSPADWALIEPYLKENQRLFGIRLEELLRVGEELRPPEAVYRKVVVRHGGVLRGGS
jgi:glutamate synthase domain-containing protein 1